MSLDAIQAARPLRPVPFAFSPREVSAARLEAARYARGVAGFTACVRDDDSDADTEPTLTIVRGG